MAQIKIDKPETDSCSLMIQSSESLVCFFNCNFLLLLFFLMCCCYWNSRFCWGDELRTKWYDLTQSFLGFLRHGSVSLVKSTMLLSYPQTFPAIGPKFIWFLMGLSLNPKSRCLGYLLKHLLLSTDQSNF